MQFCDQNIKMYSENLSICRRDSLCSAIQTMDTNVPVVIFVHKDVIVHKDVNVHNVLIYLSSYINYLYKQV